MPAEMSLWSYVAQWFGYVSWCASGSDAACRPFVGFLALAGASGGALVLLLRSLSTLLNDVVRDIERARAGRALGQTASAEAAPREPALAEPAMIGAAAAPALAAHAEPLLAASAAFPLDAEPALRALSAAAAVDPALPQPRL